MGMYTQIRGWLNVDSIGDYEGKRFQEINLLLQKAKDDFENDRTVLNYRGEPMERKWVCHDTIAHRGGNGSVYLFFGTELKNYGSPAEAWIEYLIKYFPNAEGRIDFQYEEDEYECEYWFISHGAVIKRSNNEKWCEGYGNSFKLNKESL